MELIICGTLWKNHFGHKLLRHAYSIINTKSIFYWVFRSLLGIKKTVFRVLRFTGNDYLLENYGQCFLSCKTGPFVYLLNNSNGYKTCTASIAHIFIHSHHYRMLRCFFSDEENIVHQSIVKVITKVRILNMFWLIYMRMLLGKILIFWDIYILVYANVHQIVHIMQPRCSACYIQ